MKDVRKMNRALVRLWRIVPVIIASVLILGVTNPVSADYLFDGSDGSFITGDDGGPYGNPYINQYRYKDWYDNVADTEWYPLYGAGGGLTEIGGHWYLYGNSAGSFALDDYAEDYWPEGESYPYNTKAWN